MLVLWQTNRFSGITIWRSKNNSVVATDYLLLFVSNKEYRWKSIIFSHFSLSYESFVQLYSLTKIEKYSISIRNICLIN